MPALHTKHGEFHKLLASADYGSSMDNASEIFVVSALIILDCIVVIMYLMFELEIMHVGKGYTFLHGVLHTISLSILSVFVVELFLRIFVYRVEFFKSVFEVVDALVILVSFGLDLAFSFHGDTVLTAEIQLVIVLRVWRITRILSGIAESMRIGAQQRIAMERRVAARYCRELAKYQYYCDQQAAEIKRLQTILHESNIRFPATNLTPPK